MAKGGDAARDKEFNRRPVLLYLVLAGLVITRIQQGGYPVKLYRILALPLLVLVAFFLIAARALQPTDPGDLVQVLTWLAGVGAVYVVGYGLSFLLEQVPGWGSKFPGWARGPVVILLSAGVAFGAQYLLRQTHVVELLGPIFTMIVQIILAYLGTQKAFAYQRQNRLLSGPATRA
jgi:hypothetical protein